jgi:hypothetical protein
MALGLSWRNVRLVICVVWTIGVTARAQGTTGSILGTVKDSTGGSPRATVSVLLGW